MAMRAEQVDLLEHHKFTRTANYDIYSISFDYNIKFNNSKQNTQKTTTKQKKNKKTTKQKQKCPNPYALKMTTDNK